MILTALMNPVLLQPKCKGQIQKNKNSSYAENSCNVDFAPIIPAANSHTDLINWEKTMKLT